MRKTLFIILFILTVSSPVISQTVLSGEFRPKFEFRDGYKTLLSDTQNPAFITAQRSRLILSYADAHISTKLSVQDVRIWGESAAKSDVSTINVFEAWAQYDFNEALFIRFGRQVLSFDQNRLLGESNWNDVGSSHDLLLVKYKKNFDLLAGFAYNNDKAKNFESNYPVKNYKTLGFIRVEKQLGNFINGSLILIADGNQPSGSDTRLYQRYTFGGNILLSNDSIKSRIYGTVYLQNGKSPLGSTISAYFIALNYDYRFSSKLNGIIAGEYFSGDDVFSPDTKYNSFNNLYGNGHNYYGYMDYFSQIDEDTEGGGLMDLYARALYKFSKKTSGELTYHYFSTTKNLIDSVSTPGVDLKADLYLGSEIDFVLKYKPVSNFEFNCGYSTMSAAPSMEFLKGGDHSRFQHWGWVMLIFKPEFFNTGKNLSGK